MSKRLTTKPRPLIMGLVILWHLAGIFLHLLFDFQCSVCGSIIVLRLCEFGLNLSAVSGYFANLTAVKGQRKSLRLWKNSFLKSGHRIMSRSSPTLTILPGIPRFNKIFVRKCSGAGKSYWSNARGPGILLSTLPLKYKSCSQRCC